MPTTDRHVEFPPCQPFKFQKRDFEPDDQFHTYPMDEVFFRDRLKAWQSKNTYYQKWENEQTWMIQWSANTNLGSTVDLYNSCGKNMLLANTGQHATIAGNLYDGDPMRTEHFVGNFHGIPAGYYYMVVTINFHNDAGDFADEYISEPIYIAETHPDTIILAYTHSFNKYGIFPEQFPGYFKLRVEAEVMNLRLLSNLTQYEDETTEMTPLNDDPYRGWSFITGHLPEWMGDKLMRILAMDTVYANTQQITKDKDAKWNIQRTPNVPLAGYSIDVRVMNENAGHFTTPTPPPPFVCTNVNIDMTILPWPDWNIITHNNDGGIDRSIVKAKFNPALAGLTPPYTALWYQFIGSGITPITGRPGIPDFDPNSYENYFQRSDTAFENGDTTISCAATITDSNGCQSLAGSVIDFSVVPPWGPYESVDKCGQLANSDFVGFTVSNITNNSFDIDIDNPVPGDTYYVSLDGGLSLWGPGWNGLSTYPVTGLPSATTQNIYIICGTSHPQSIMGPRLETTLP